MDPPPGEGPPSAHWCPHLAFAFVTSSSHTGQNLSTKQTKRPAPKVDGKGRGSSSFSFFCYQLAACCCSSGWLLLLLLPGGAVARPRNRIKGKLCTQWYLCIVLWIDRRKTRHKIYDEKTYTTTSHSTACASPSASAPAVAEDEAGPDDLAAATWCWSRRRSSVRDMTHSRLRHQRR